MYPLKFKPVYKEVVWGGNKIAEVFGRNVYSEGAKPIGESWELSSHPEGMSIAANGDLEGTPLVELLKQYQEQILGPSGYVVKDGFPLLIKIIDAQDRLSVQVHPGDEYAARVEGQAGKTEAWYIIEAKENAQIVYGLDENVSQEKFLQLVKQNRVNEAVRYVPVETGDMVYVPAGIVHALLDGVLVYEVQQNSAVTYRVYDYDRVGLDGKPRELHISKALDVIRFGDQPSTDFKVHSVNCKYFSMEKLQVQGELHQATQDHFLVYCIIRGNGSLVFDIGRESLRPGDTVLVPACLGSFKLEGEFEGLKIY